MISLTTANELGQYPHLSSPHSICDSRVVLGGLKVDIGINNVDGVTAVDVINDHLDRMPALRPLVLVVKAFLAQKDLNSAAKSGLSSYALICMAISFVQVRIPPPPPPPFHGDTSMSFFFFSK